jgi:beta-N-acetylhexosaminidase
VKLSDAKSGSKRLSPGADLSSRLDGGGGARDQCSDLLPLLLPLHVGRQVGDDQAVATEPHGIDRLSPPSDLVMEVRTRGEPRHADEPDHVALSDVPRTVDAGLDPRQMGVPGAEAVRVLNLDEETVPAIRAGELDDAVRGGMHGGPRGRGQIDAGVGENAVEDGVEPSITEAGAHARRLHRPRPSAPIERTPEGVVIAGCGVALEVDRRVDPPADRDLCAEDPDRARCPVGPHGALVDHAEPPGRAEPARRKCRGEDPVEVLTDEVPLRTAQVAGKTVDRIREAPGGEPSHERGVDAESGRANRIQKMRVRLRPLRTSRRDGDGSERRDQNESHGSDHRRMSRATPMEGFVVIGVPPIPAGSPEERPTGRRIPPGVSADPREFPTRSTDPPMQFREPLLRPKLILLSLSLTLLGGSAVPVDGRADAPREARPEARALAWADLPPDGAVWVEETLASLDLRGRVSQLVFPWIRGGAIPRNSTEYRRIQRWIREDRVGGLIVSRGPAAEFAPTLNQLQGESAVPLLILSDLETGPSMRLTGGTSLPPAMAFGAAGDERLAYEAGRLTATEARAAGIHVTLGPVLDVNSNPLNPIINTRSFGADPVRVGALAAAWVAGARTGGLLTVGKHFPGHGATEVDSHIGLPTIAADLPQLDELELVPFRRAFQGGMSGVLVGHIGVPAVDGGIVRPASLSPTVIGEILRRREGFQGLVVTDALNMGAITRNYSVPEAAILALLAGADVLLQPPGERDVIEAVVRAVENGRIPRERIDEAARRVLTAKAAAGLHESARAPGGRAPADHAGVARDVSAASITLARDRLDLVPLRPEHRRILHVAYSGDGGRFTAPSFGSTIAGASRSLETVPVNQATTAATYRTLAERASRVDLVIVSANLFPREYRALALEGRYSHFVSDLVAKGVPVVAVSFGSPYIIDSFPSVPAYLLAWSSSAEGQRAAARALLGSSPITGTLPISLPPHHALGDGIRRAAR